MQFSINPLEVVVPNLQGLKIIVLYGLANSFSKKQAFTARRRGSASDSV